MGGEKFHVFILHAAARIVVGIIGGEQKMLGAEVLDRFSELRFLGFDGPVKVRCEILARRQPVLFSRRRPAAPIAALWGLAGGASLRMRLRRLRS